MERAAVPSPAANGEPAMGEIAPLLPMENPSTALFPGSAAYKNDPLGWTAKNEGLVPAVPTANGDPGTGLKLPSEAMANPAIVPWVGLAV